MGFSRYIFISPISLDHICLACEDVFRNPYTSSCGHTLCHNCWLNRVEQRALDGEEVLVCMHCREQLIMAENKLKLNSEIQESILSLLVRCGNHECPRQLPLASRELHMEVCRHNDRRMQLCCLKTSRRTNRIMRRGGRILKTVSHRAFLRMCKTALDSALETYTKHINKVLDPLAEKLEAIEELMSSESDTSDNQGVYEPRRQVQSCQSVLSAHCSNN